MSELALKLIAENKRTHSSSLDLDNCGLTEVPQEIGELVWLEELSFASEWGYRDNKEWVTKVSQNTGTPNKIAHLTPATFQSRTFSMGKAKHSSPFSGLVWRLKKLFLNGSVGKKMDFSDLSPLSDLTNLQQLDVSNTPVTDLSPFSGLVFNCVN